MCMIQSNIAFYYYCFIICSGFSGYGCECSVGFTGSVCQYNIDDCDGSPCPDNTTCVDKVASYDCVCLSDWPCAQPDHEAIKKALVYWWIIVLICTLILLVVIIALVLWRKYQRRLQR